MHRPSILVFGEALWDLFPTGAKFGGAPANFACHAARLGADVTLLTGFGQDPRGDQALTLLQQFGVDTSLIQRPSQAPTGTVAVTLDAAGKPTFRIEPEVAWDLVNLTPAVENAVARVDAIYFGTLGQRSPTSRATCRHILHLAQQRGIPRILDINLRTPFYTPALLADSIQLATVLKLSSDELPEVAQACGLSSSEPPEPVLHQLRERNALTHIAMSCGADGAWLVSATETVRQPGLTVSVRDTVGAGDAFAAALTVGLLRHEPLAQIARQACELGAATCTHEGALPPVSQPRPD